MADNDDLNHNEYQFTELDPLNPEVQEESTATTATPEPTMTEGFLGQNHIKRNAIIAVILFVILMLLYKLLGAYFTGKSSAITPVNSPPVPTLQPVASPPPAPPPVVQPSSVPPPVSLGQPKVQLSPDLSSKISDMEFSQHHLSSEVAEFNSQLGTVSANIETLSNKVSALNQVISSLNDKLESQSREIERLTIKSAPKIVHEVKIAHPKYYVQAVIPGRAWLIATNGNTLTVREGSIVPHYGIVKLIDAQQGRVMTSSGKVIRFSQYDS